MFIHSSRHWPCPVRRIVIKRSDKHEKCTRATRAVVLLRCELYACPATRAHVVTMLYQDEYYEYMYVKLM